MTDHPNPLTPPECDLRDFPRMMIDITRLRSSDFDATPDDCAWRAGLNLWFSAWHSVPAGSLSDDDSALVKAAGLGRDLKTWKRIREAALRGFDKCSDGRLYHATVCELALESWIEKLVQRLSSGAGNAKRWGADFDPAKIEMAIDEAVALLSALAPSSKSIAKARRRHSKKPVTDVPTEVVGNPDGKENASHRDKENIPSGSQETGTGEETGIIKKEGEEEREREFELEPDNPPKPDPCSTIFDAWNAMAAASDLPTALKLTDERRKRLRARIDDYGEPTIVQAIGEVPNREFLNGHGDRGWKADFDFLLRPNSVAKILEGSYLNGKRSHNGSAERGSVFDAVSAALHEVSASRQ